MENIKSVKVYGAIGKVLCGLAGGVVGFFIGGPLVILPGILLGAVAGHLFKKSILSNVS